MQKVRVSDLDDSSKRPDSWLCAHGGGHGDVDEIYSGIADGNQSDAPVGHKADFTQLIPLAQLLV